MGRKKEEDEDGCVMRDYEGRIGQNLNHLEEWTATMDIIGWGVETDSYFRGRGDREEEL